MSLLQETGSKERKVTVMLRINENKRFFSYLSSAEVEV
jgi:hypothetical protein